MTSLMVTGRVLPLDKNTVFFTNLLVDDAGVPVACKKRHSTCQGVKACPLNDVETLTGPAHQHTSATLEDIEIRLAADRAARQRLSCPRRDVLVKTASFITAIRTVGCHRPLQQPTHRTGEELQQWEADQAQKQFFRRGYRPPPMCEGRIVYHEYADPKYPDSRPPASITCAAPPTTSPILASRTAGLDEEYIAAVFLDNTDEIARIEGAAATQEVGPLAQCKTLLNHSAQTLYCLIDHRVDGRLAQHELRHLDCAVKFRIWFPVDKHRCPFVLVTSSGTHRHPIPLPEKTPQRAHLHITCLLRSLRHDLPNMTPHHFLCHPTVKTFLADLFPDLANPTLCALHPSLANRAHLGAYITLARRDHFPRGTDWEGVKYLKTIQDRDVPAHEHYIRVVLEIPNESLDHHEEDDDAPTSSKTTRIIICMTPDSSKRLQQAQYLQSDIGFKRIVGFDEFEIAAMDRDANKSVVFCRVYLTRQTAAAHQRIFDELSKIVEKDTGTPLLWRHLHGQTPDDCRVGLILQWGADQHRGQAKGLGLHLIAQAALLPPDAMDMHEPHRSLRSLTPYEHLQRVYRQCAVPEVVRQKMRSLAGSVVRAAEPVSEISQFAFAGICWQRSFIPLDVWRVGNAHTNLIETVHRDVNREGVHCTLLGGLLRGQDYDEMQRVALKEYEAHGIRRSYHAAHPVTNAVKNVIRQSNNQAHRVEAQSRGVATHNKNMQKFDQQYRAALAQLEHLLRLGDAPHLREADAQRAIQLQVENARGAVRSASTKYDHQVQVGQQLRDEGRAGRLPFSSPPLSPPQPASVAANRAAASSGRLIAVAHMAETWRNVVWPALICGLSRAPYSSPAPRRPYLSRPRLSSAIPGTATSSGADVGNDFRLSAQQPALRRLLIKAPYLGLLRPRRPRSAALPIFAGAGAVDGRRQPPAPPHPAVDGSSCWYAALCTSACSEPATATSSVKFDFRLSTPFSADFSSRRWGRRSPARPTSAVRLLYISTTRCSLVLRTSSLHPPSAAHPNAHVTAADLAAASANLVNTAAATGRCDICNAQHLVVFQNAHGPNGLHTGPLPHWRTCTPPFCPEHPGIDVLTGKVFYVALPARHEAIYTSAQMAREQTEGVHNGVAKSCKTWDEVKGHWVLGCLRWHGNECRRERLQRADATGKNWAVLGTDIVCGSRAAAFRVAQDHGFDDIRIRSHRDVSVLRNWLENGSRDEESSDDD
ncbi:hypothetical protein C8R47DRAFT_1230425 [Mycena vitilis]|nr:hypothetical protein C8R47DRAFT_1230425 [Mycena vitilis]